MQCQIGVEGKIRQRQVSLSLNVRRGVSQEAIEGGLELVQDRSVNGYHELCSSVFVCNSRRERQNTRAEPIRRPATDMLSLYRRVDALAW